MAMKITETVFVFFSKLLGHYGHRHFMKVYLLQFQRFNYIDVSTNNGGRWCKWNRKQGKVGDHTD